MLRTKVDALLNFEAVHAMHALSSCVVSTKKRALCIDITCSLLMSGSTCTSILQIRREAIFHKGQFGTARFSPWPLHHTRTFCANKMTLAMRPQLIGATALQSFSSRTRATSSCDHRIICALMDVLGIARDWRMVTDRPFPLGLPKISLINISDHCPRPSIRLQTFQYPSVLNIPPPSRT